MSAPRRRLSSTARREQLLDAAVQLAAGRDLASLSVRDIAAHAGVSEGLLFHYFPTKDALLAGAVQRAADAMLRALDGVAGLEPMMGLSAGLAAYLDHVQADPTGWRALLGARTGPLAETAAAVEARGRAITLDLLGAPQPSLCLAAAVDGWAALEREVCRSWLDQPDLPRATVEDLLLGSFLGALEAAARHDRQAREVLDRLRPAVGPASGSLTAVFELFPDDLDQTADFYARVLGFALTDDRRGTEQPYLGMQRDGARLGAATVLGPGRREHRLPPTGVELVLEVDDLVAERERVRQAGWPVAQELALQPWGRRDFRLLDPSGYALRITER